jgi:hypothetical protein
MATENPHRPDPLPAAQDASEDRVLRVIVDHEVGIAPERAVRAGYLETSELADILGIHSTEAAEIIEQLRRRIPYHDRLGEEDLYLIPAAAVGAPYARRRLSPASTRGAELRQLYDRGCRGLEDIDMDELLWRIFADVQSSYTLALQHAEVPAQTVAEVTATVEDYMANHYGGE